jgi:hypothetical protein
VHEDTPVSVEEQRESGSERMGNIIIPYGSKILRFLKAK